MKKVEIEKIAVEVELEAKKRGYPEDIPEFESQYIFNTDFYVHYDSQILEENVKDLSEYEMISEYPTYFGRGLKAIFKRLVKKLVRFYVLPVVEMQNLFNHSAKEVGTQLYADSLVKEKQIEELKKEIEELKKQIKELK